MKFNFIGIFNCFWIVFLLPLAGRAEPVSPDHLLYPVDQDLIFFSGIDDSISLNRAELALERCRNQEPLIYDRELCQAADIIRQHNLTLNQFPWQQVTAQVIFFGERHLDQEIKLFLHDHLENLMEQGVTALGLEMFNSSSQPLLDDYHAGRATLREVEIAFNTQWGYESSGYLRLIRRAKSRGLRIIALDKRVPKADGSDFEQIQVRDVHMAAQIASYMVSNPTGKMAVLTGRLHSYRIYSRAGLVNSLPELVRINYHLSTQSFVTFGAKDQAGFNMVQMALFGSGASSVVPLPSEYGYADFILFLR